MRDVMHSSGAPLGTRVETQSETRAAETRRGGAGRVGRDPTAHGGGKTAAIRKVVIKRSDVLMDNAILPD